jgi:hypothetical protein
MSEYMSEVTAALARMSAEGAASVESYRDARLTRILDAGSASRIIGDILADEGLLAETAARSYAHSNGFDKITLLSNRAPEFKLRLHAWWPRQGGGESPEFVHDHRWHFRSTVLRGSAHVEFFIEKPGGLPVFRHEYVPRDASERYGLKVVGPTFLASYMMVRLAPGSTYTMGPDALHRVVWVGGEVSLTMFVRWESVHPSASVFAEARIVDGEMLSVPSFTSDQLRSKLCAVLSALV